MESVRHLARPGYQLAYRGYLSIPLSMYYPIIYPVFDMLSRVLQRGIHATPAASPTK